MSKIPGVTLHARERFVERFGHEPSRDQWLEAVRLIIDREAALLSTICQGGAAVMERWVLSFNTIEVVAFWSPQTGQIVTVQDISTHGMNPDRRREREAKANRRYAKQDAGRYVRQRHRWQGEGRDA